MSTTTRRELLAAGGCLLAVALPDGVPAAAQPLRLGPAIIDDPASPEFLDPRPPAARPGVGVEEPSPALGQPFVGDPRAMYAASLDEPYPVPGLRASGIKPEFRRLLVDYGGPEPAGAIVIDPRSHHLHYVQGDGTAVRYGVGVGRTGFSWAGEALIHDKRVWPDWYPPAEMLERQPELAAKMQALQSGTGMPGGPGNPLGARALYLWQGRKDTLFRVHGTVEPWSIGRSVSSGCIRMINQDIIDLYDRVALGTRVVVLGVPAARRARRPAAPG